MSTAAPSASVPPTAPATAPSPGRAVSPEGHHIRHFLLRRLHSLTGLMFGGYLVIHLIVNASMIEGAHPRDIYQGLVNQIHALPLLVGIEWALIYLPIIFHTVYGIWVTFASQPNVLNYPYGKNIFYTLQRISAMIIVGFVLFHVLGMKGLLGGVLTFDPQAATASTIRHINAHWTVAYLVYPLGVLASTYHLANGFWTAAITWGLTVSKQAQRRWGVICLLIFLFTFGCGMLALFATIRSRMIIH